jgi:hypothetical protein
MGNKLLRFTTYFSHVCLSVLLTVGVIYSGVKCLAVADVSVDYEAEFLQFLVQAKGDGICALFTLSGIA